jgi:hypothetical protein
MSDTADTAWPEDPASAATSESDPDSIVVSEHSAQQREADEAAPPE